MLTVSPRFREIVFCSTFSTISPVAYPLLNICLAVIGPSGEGIVCTPTASVFARWFPISTVAIAAIALALYRCGFFGGADAKALVAISVILPIYYPLMSFYVHPVTGITVLTNAVLFALVVPLYNALSNLVKVARGEQIFEGFEKERKWRKVLACFVGTPTSDKEKMHHSSVIEALTGEGKKRFSFRLNCDDHDASYRCRDMHSYSRASTDGSTWLSQNLPFLVFMLAGFSAAMLIGDILFQLLLH